MFKFWYLTLLSRFFLSLLVCKCRQRPVFVLLSLVSHLLRLGLLRFFRHCEIIQSNLAPAGSMDVSTSSNFQMPTLVRMPQIIATCSQHFTSKCKTNSLLMSNCCVCNCKLVSSILSTLSLPRFSVLPPEPSLSPSPPSPPPPPPPPQRSDTLCGSCPSPGSAPQTNSIWPSMSPSGAGFPGWPGQTTQPAPCWTGQPNTPCWPGTQPAPFSVPAPVSYPAPVQTITPAPGPATTIVPAPAPAPAQVPVQVPAQAPVPVQPCQPYWPGTQCQPPNPPAPVQPQVPAQIPAPTPVPVTVPPPVPTTGLHPNVAGWPAHPGWPYNPGQSGWPGQNPSIMPPHWLPPTSGPLVS